MTMFMGKVRCFIPMPFSHLATFRLMCEMEGLISCLGAHTSSTALEVLVFCTSAPIPSSHEPSLPRVVAGELGVVMVATRDLEEALYAFTLARNWIDIAFVAERCMTVDELVKFMCGSRGAPYYAESLRGLLMRRLVRCGRLDEALQWAPSELKDLCAEYCSLWREAHNTNGEADDRAVAFFNLSRLTLTRGMELMGTELGPDMTIYDGDYADNGIPSSEPSDLAARLGKGGSSLRWDGWKSSEKRERDRFHYRRKAIEFARAGVIEDILLRMNQALIGSWSMIGFEKSITTRSDIANFGFLRDSRRNSSSGWKCPPQNSSRSWP